MVYNRNNRNASQSLFDTYMALFLQLIDYGAKGTFRQLIHMFRMYKEEVRITTPPFAATITPLVGDDNVLEPRDAAADR